MTEPPLRRATAKDADAIAALVDRAYRKYLPRIGRPPAPMTDDYHAVLRDHEVWVVDGRVAIDALLVLMPDADALFIDNIAVDPARQQSGLGRMLMAFAEDEARRRGLSALTLVTNEHMTENIAFYTRLGFVETSRELRRGSHTVHMRKALLGAGIAIEEDT